MQSTSKRQFVIDGFTLTGGADNSYTDGAVIDGADGSANTDEVDV